MKRILLHTTIWICLFTSNQIFAQTTKAIPPIEFIQNQGQWDGPFVYKGTTSRADFFLRKDGFRIMLSDDKNHDIKHGLKHGWITGPQKLHFHAFDIQFEHANPDVTFTSEKPQKHYYNYYLGNDASRWKTGIHPVLAVNYQKLYDNIDAHIYTDNGNVKYDLILHPNGNIQDVQIAYSGLDSIKLNKGKLILSTSLGDIQESIPYSYQYINGERKEVKCKFILNHNKVSFDIGKEYNNEYDLYIDPVLVFCTFTGSTADNWGYTATYDSSGNFYAGGIASGVGYPTSLGCIQPSYGGGNTVDGNLYPADASFSKFNASGTVLIYGTYLGGISNDQPHSIIVDSSDHLCIAGRTYSNNFPTTTGCYDNTYNGGADMFVAKFNSAGTVLLGSTYIGGTGNDGVNEEAQEFLGGVLKHNYADDARTEIINDNANNVYIASCTQSFDFPTTANAFQSANAGLQDAVIFELNDNLTSLIWSTYAGGSNNDAAYVLTFNKTNLNELFVGGGTMSSNYPSSASALNPAYQGGTVDGFVMKINAATKALQTSTFIGTSQYDQVYGVQTDFNNNVYITGQTLGAYPTTAGTASNAGSYQFISKLNNNLNSITSSLVYGSGPNASLQTNISPNAFLVDICGNVYVSGWGGAIGGPFSSSTVGMPITINALQSATDGNDFYFVVYNSSLTSLIYGSYFGQNGGVSEHVDGGTSRFDSKGVIYQAICAHCGNPVGITFPTTPGVVGPLDLSPNCNLAALKIDFQLQNPSAQAQTIGDTVGCAPFVVNFLNSSVSATGYVWNFGDNSPTSTQTSPSHTYTTAGIYTVTLIALNPTGCNATADTTNLIIIVKNDSIHASFTAVKKDSCQPFTAIMNNTSTTNGTTNHNPNTTFTWDFGDGSGLYTGQNPPLHSFPSNGIYTITLTMVDTNSCNGSSSATFVVNYTSTFVAAAFDIPDSLCMPAFITYLDQSTNASTWSWTFGDNNTSNLSNPTNTYVAPGVYNVILVAGNPATCNKLDTASQTISVFTSPVAGFTWSPNPPTPNTPNKFTNLSTGATKYLWDFGDGTSSTNKDEVHVYFADGYYTVCLTATNAYGCRDTACKTVRGLVLPLVDVPTGFSPNGDGINDVVYVKGYGIQKMAFKIFNRWGEKIFETNDISVGWDGRYKGILQEMEVYGYTLSVTFFDGSKDFKKGNITLLK